MTGGYSSAANLLVNMIYCVEMCKKKNVYPYKLNILKKNEEEMKLNGEKNPVKLTSHFLVLSQRMFLF